MHVSVCKMTLRLPENETLKGKRRVVSSLCTRIHRKFNVSIAEVENSRAWQLATLGVSCASNSSRHAGKVLDSVVAYVENSRDDLELIAEERETLSGF